MVMYLQVLQVKREEYVMGAVQTVSIFFWKKYWGWTEANFHGKIEQMFDLRKGDGYVTFSGNF